MSQDALDLLLTGVKDQGQRKQITSAYYAFAAGDPETFAVQFAVLLRAHAMSLKALPERLQKALATETHKLSDLVITHRTCTEKLLSFVDQAGQNDGVGEGSDAVARIQKAIEERLTEHGEVLRGETEKLVSAITENGRVLQKFYAHRIVLGLVLSYVAGILTVPTIQYLLPVLLSCFTSAWPRPSP
jgi:hypothetical protein